MEFYFMLTGYFTALHFDGIEDSDSCCKDAFYYVKNKVAKLLPYAWTGIAIGFLCCFVQPSTW